MNKMMRSVELGLGEERQAGGGDGNKYAQQKLCQQTAGCGSRNRQQQCLGQASGA